MNGMVSKEKIEAKDEYFVKKAMKSHKNTKNIPIM